MKNQKMEKRGLKNEKSENGKKGFEKRKKVKGFWWNQKMEKRVLKYEKSENGKMGFEKWNKGFWKMKITQTCMRLAKN